MGLDGDANEQIARRAAVFARAALPPQGDGLAVVDARRDGDGQLLLPPDAPRAAAGFAGLVDDLSGTAAAGAGRGGGEGEASSSPLDPDHAAAVTVGTDLRRGAGGAAGALALLAGLRAGDGDLLLAAEGRLFEGDGHPGPDGLSLLGGVAAAAASASAAEAPAEEGAEQVAQVLSLIHI